MSYSVIMMMSKIMKIMSRIMMMIPMIMMTIPKDLDDDGNRYNCGRRDYL